MVTDYAQEALNNLRDPSHLQWYVIPLLVIVIYIYSSELKKAQETHDWSTVTAGLALFGMDLINEIWNALVLHFTRHAAFWMTPGDSAFIILIGWNIEIAFMFSLAGLAFANTLPENKDLTIPIGPVNLNNRWVLAIGYSWFAVFVEILLNKAGMLIWTYWFWNGTIIGVWLIFLLGYLHFFVVAFLVYDMKTTKNKIITLLVIYGIGLTSLVLFMGILKWI